MFKDGESPPNEQLDIDELIRTRSTLYDLINSPGWAYLKSRLVGMANEMTEKWTRGGLDAEENARLGAKVELIGVIMGLPESDLSEYNSVVEDDVTEDDGGNPSVSGVESF